MYERLLKALFDAYNKSLDFSSNVMDSLDGKKYSEAVTELYGQPPEYKELDVAIKLIEQDSNTPLEKKLSMLEAVHNLRNESYAKEMERKKKSAEIIDEGNQKKADLAVKVACGVMTGGVSLLPDAVRALTGVGKNKKKNYVEYDISEEN